MNLRSKWVRIFSVVLLLVIAGCATAPKPTEETAANENGESVAVSKELSDAANSSHPDEIENSTIGDIIRNEEPNTQSLYDNSRYDFPITVNSKVEGWIDYFTGRGREHMERYLGRSSRYIPIMKKTLKATGLPEDLVYLALIESGFNLKANSRARAVGPWQFIKATGKRYGLRVDAWIDERRDPIKSTVAAARYLKDLYLMFESWYLAASAYNAGEYKILRAIEELKTNNFWRISDTRLIRNETKDYVPKLIAAAIIAKNPSRYGFDDVDYQEPLEFETVTVNFPLHLREISKLTNATMDELEELNPHLRRTQIPPGIGAYDVRVPVGTRTVVDRALAKLRDNGDSSSLSGGLPFEHTVRSGETLASIAKRYRLRAKDLANANNVSPKEKVNAGDTLIIPNKGGTQSKNLKTVTKEKRNVSATTASTSESDSDSEFITHTVRRGESLWSISEKYDVTVQDIFKWNNLKRSQIHPGKRLKIRSNNSSETTVEGRAKPKGRSKVG